MIEEIKLPDIGDGIEGGDVVGILVKEGSEIEIDSVLMELETEKAVFEFPSPIKGTVAKVCISESEFVKVGQALFEVEVSGENKDQEKEQATAETDQKEAKKKEARSESEQLEKENEGSEEKPKEDETKREKPKDQESKPEESKEEEQESKEEEKISSHSEGKESKPISSYASPAASVPAGPAARRLARELGVDLTQVSGSGKGDRITLDDVKAFAKDQLTGPASRQSSGTSELPDFSVWGPVERKPLASLRRKTAEKLEQAWLEVPLVTQFDEADITDLEAMRKKNSQFVKDKGGRLTITVFLLKAVAAALKEFPQFNCSLDLRQKEAIYKSYYNIGVAVDTPAGLIVPVIKNVDQKSIVDLSIELSEMAEKAKARKVTPEEIRGGNISISNLGGISGTGFTPLVVPPDVAVVGVSKSSLKPVWRDEKFEPRLIMPFSVSYDHRMIDGADGARFTKFLAQMLENSERLLLEG